MFIHHRRFAFKYMYLVSDMDTTHLQGDAMTFKKIVILALWKSRANMSPGQKDLSL